MCIKDIFCFTLPIGWDELGVIATVLAVVVALYANRKATKQLISALKMQEQSKNVSLVDKRIELAESIQSGKRVSKLSLQILFNDEIFQHYQAWENHITEKVYAEHDLETFFLSIKIPDGAGGYADKYQFISTLQKYESDMSKPDCPQQIIDEYEAFCNKHTVWLPTGENAEPTAFNHSEISKRVANANSEAQREHAATLQLIEKIISESIQQI